MSVSTQRLLTSKGIGTKYVPMSLTNYGHPIAQNIVEWLDTEEAVNHFAVGKGMNFFSDNEAGYDVAMLAARALILSKLPKLQAISFVDMLDETIQSSFWEKKSPIFIHNFYPQENFIPTIEYRKLESLVNFYLDNSIAIIIHSPTVTLGDCVNPVLLDRLSKINKNFSI